MPETTSALKKLLQLNYSSYILNLTMSFLGSDSKCSPAWKIGRRRIELFISLVTQRCFPPKPRPGFVGQIFETEYEYNEYTSHQMGSGICIPNTFTKAREKNM